MQRIVEDAALKMGVEVEDVFMFAAAESKVSHDWEAAYAKWLDCHTVPNWTENFCLDILTGRIPLIELPVKAKKRR